MDAMGFSEEEDFYPCSTQIGTQQTIGELPRGKESGLSDGHHGIVVGMRSMVPRWITSSSGPTLLSYFVVRDGFKNDEDFCYTVTTFQQAADEWNAIEFGVNIFPTTDPALANFNVKFAERHGTLFARAFFPDEKDRNVFVYNSSFANQKARLALQNIFLHEIGHIIGLRHEFAIDGDAHNKREGNSAVRFGNTNPKSVMSYNLFPVMQETDKTDVMEFYKLPNYSEIGGVRIYDFTPTPVGH